MFGVVSAVLLRPLPYRDPGRLVMIWEKWQVNRDMKGVDPDVAARLAERSAVMTTVLEAWRKENRVFEDVAGFLSLEASLTGGGEPEQIAALAASSPIFTTLGISPALGRAFTADDDVPERDEVAVISHALWMRRFGGDGGVLGKTIGIDGVPHAIVGVMPKGFHVILPRVPAEPDVIVPIPHSYAPGRKWSLVMAIARLKPGVTIAGARTDMSALYTRMAESNRRYRSRDANVVWLTGEVARDARLGLLVLFGATGCVLIIGCINVANLLLLRAAGRSRDMAVRAALGAGRWRLARQVIGEAVALASAGGAAGLVLATWGVRVLLAAMPHDLFPRIADVRIDLTVLAFGFVVSLAVGLAASVAPIWHTLARDRRGAVNRVLAGDHRTSSESRGQRLTRRTLVVAQVAIAMVLLVGAGLLAETYVRLTRVDLGLDPSRVLTFGLTLPAARYSSSPSLIALQDALLARLEPLPGVEAVGLTNSLPVQPAMLASMTVEAEGQPASEIPESVNVRTVSPGFFRAAGLRTAYGRLLAASDATADVAVVNRVLVRRFWPTAPPAGPRSPGTKTEDRHALVATIVGVVEDVKYLGPDRRSEQEAYVPLAFWPMGYMYCARPDIRRPDGDRRPRAPGRARHRSGPPRAGHQDDGDGGGGFDRATALPVHADRGVRSHRTGARRHRPLRRDSPVGRPARQGDGNPDRARRGSASHCAPGARRRFRRRRDRRSSRRRRLGHHHARAHEVPVRGHRNRSANLHRRRAWNPARVRVCRVWSDVARDAIGPGQHPARRLAVAAAMPDAVVEAWADLGRPAAPAPALDMRCTCSQARRTRRPDGSGPPQACPPSPARSRLGAAGPDHGLRRRVHGARRGDRRDAGHPARTSCAEIGRRAGPLDLSLLPIGAYEPRWFMQFVHMNPAEAVQAHLDLASPLSIGMHFGTFQLTTEGIDEPVRALDEARRARGVPLSQFRTLAFGESLVIPPVA